MPTDVGSRVYRGAVIGAGGIARSAHVPALRQDKGVRARLEVVAVVDSADVAPIEGLPLVRDLAELDRFGSLDFIDICTPTASHMGLVLWGLERGLHVVCEKPVALDQAEAARIAAAARRAGRVVMPCHQYRYNPAWRQVREWLAADVIGRWHLAEFAVYRQFADPGARTDGAPWRGTSGTGRGGVLLDHGTHLLYQVLDAAGWPHMVRAWTARLRHQDYDVEDTAHIALEYPGRAVTLFLTWAARHRETRLRFTGERGVIEWNGGELRLDSPERAERLDFTRELDKASYWHWFASLFADFVVAMDRAEGEPALADIARVATLLESCYAAARTPGLAVPNPP
ncbi:MAG TPA: Gfo/Idh/MocA family oxidoreductase [Gemmatimonadales bacterium]|nr:Gfo/Idh/MocA family oxidoreductase [Gemmatimonadales bacterium]